MKVIAINEPLNVSGGETKQDVTVADSTSTSRLTLWQENVDTLTQSQSVLPSFKHGCARVPKSEVSFNGTYWNYHTAN